MIKEPLKPRSLIFFMMSRGPTPEFISYLKMPRLVSRVMLHSVTPLNFLNSRSSLYTQLAHVIPSICSSKVAIPFLVRYNSLSIGICNVKIRFVLECKAPIELELFFEI